MLGAPRADQGTIDAPIHDAYEGGRRRIAKPGEPSREAVTRFKVLERFEGGALLEVELETGRQHQIRLHLAHIGLTVLGDPVYGRADRKAPATHAPAAPRQMLHARTLAFSHPRTGASVRVESPLPADFAEALKRAAPRPCARPRPCKAHAAALSCSTMIDRSDYSVRKTRLNDVGSDRALAALSPGDRVAMVWTLTLQAWMFKEGVDEPRVQRDVVRTLRGSSSLKR